MITATVIGTEAVAAKFDRITNAATSIIKAGVTRAAYMLRDYIKREKLTGQVLKNRTGTLRRSINAQIMQEEGSIVGKVGTNLAYAKTHELGLTVPAHFVAPRSKKALAFQIGGETFFSRGHEIPAVKMQARPFLKPSLAENRSQIKMYLKAAVEEALKA